MHSSTGSAPPSWCGGLRLALGALAGILSAPAQPATIDGYREVLFIAGPASHGSEAHEFPRGAELLAEALNQSGLAVTAAVAHGWPNDHDQLARADVLVIYSDGGPDHVARRQARMLQRRLAAGRGLVVLHYALEPPEDDPELRDALSEALGAIFEPGWSVNPIWQVDSEPNPTHPAARGVSRLAIEDEWYFHLRFREGANLQAALAALPNPQTLGEDGPRSGNPAVRTALRNKEPQLLAWTIQTESGARGFGFTGGHFHRNWYQSGFRTFVLNGIVWAAGLEVPAQGVASATPSVPLHETIEHAIARGDADDVQRHLAANPKLANQTSAGRPPPLHQALLRRHADVALTLIEHGSDIQAADTSGRTALHLVVIRNVPAIASVLFERGADLERRDQQGWTPLHHAAARKDSQFTSLLLERGTDPNVRSGAGGTPLHEAAASGAVEVARLLLAAGTDPSIRSDTGVTALDLAREYGHPEVVKLLEAPRP